MPGSQEVFHRYKKVSHYSFTLKDRQQRIMIPRFSKEVKLSYDLSHDSHQSVQVVAQYGEKKTGAKKL